MAASGFVKDLEEFENCDEDLELKDDELLSSDPIVEESQPSAEESQPLPEAPKDAEIVEEPIKQASVELPTEPTCYPQPPIKPEEFVPLHPELEIVENEEDQLPEMMEDWSGIQPVKSRRGAGSATSMSTIHPDVVKKRVKQTISRRENAQALTRIRAKGEASAATRKKRENKELIRADGIWGWDN